MDFEYKEVNRSPVVWSDNFFNEDEVNLIHNECHRLNALGILSADTGGAFVEVKKTNKVTGEVTKEQNHLSKNNGCFLEKTFGSEPLAITGNFPYNISTQIIFKTLEHRNQIPFFSGMFQKEVAERICESPGSKKYGILSVLTQLFYKTELLFEVSPEVFKPKPKVISAVIKLERKENLNLDCDEKLLFKIVRLSFQQRRKTLRNSLKILNLPEMLREDSIFDKRPEMLSGKDFVQLAKRIGHGNISN